MECLPIQKMKKWDIDFNKQKISYMGDHAGNTLYHFTNASTLFLILGNMSLKLSDFSNLNDLNEANINNFYIKDFEHRKLISDDILSDFKLICFSQNANSKRGITEGINHPAMWAHYADNTNGVCLVLDKQRLIESNHLVMNDTNKFQTVDYNLCSDQETSQYNGIDDFFMENFEKVFFSKLTNWSYEDEVRLCGNKLPLYLDISKSLRYICLGNSFANDVKLIKSLKEAINYKHNRCSKFITEDSFALQTYEAYGYGVTYATGVLGKSK